MPPDITTHYETLQCHHDSFVVSEITANPSVCSIPLLKLVQASNKGSPKAPITLIVTLTSHCSTKHMQNTSCVTNIQCRLFNTRQRSYDFMTWKLTTHYWRSSVDFSQFDVTVPLCHAVDTSWWRHEMEIFSALLALCNPPIIGGFPSQRPVTRSFDIFFNLRLNKRFSKQSRRRWLEISSRSLKRHCTVTNYTVKSCCCLEEGVCVTAVLR